MTSPWLKPLCWLPCQIPLRSTRWMPAAAAIENQQQALQQLVDQGWIGNEEFEAALKEEITFADAPLSAPPFAAAYTDLVLRQLAGQLGQQRIERGGLRIITTLDYDQQLEMTCTARTPAFAPHRPAQPGEHV